MLAKLRKTFLDVFKEKNDSEYFSPGRINLIGEHTDYNGGNVFPAAITIGTYGLVRRRDDELIRFYSMNFPDVGVKDIKLSELEYKEEDDWTNYPKGVIYLLKQSGYDIRHGFDILFYGTIPNGAGLSSSASIELLTGLVISDECGLNIPRLDLVKLGQKVENNYIGVNSGIMDQFAIGMGEENNAILLNTNTLEYDLVPAVFGEYVIMIMNTNKRRELADSKYNERRSECEDALKQLQKHVDIKTLCDLSVAEFNENSQYIDNETVRKRAKHAITENERTLEAKKALTDGDLETFGKLLNASHESLKNDYDVTGIELDTLVDYAQKQPGVLGARMTGAGFGGCAIALVNKDNVDSFEEVVGNGYKEKIGYAADFYEASIGDGTRKLS